MKAIIDFFNTLGSLIVNLVNFVVTLFKDLLFIIQSLALFVVHIPDYFAWLPSTALVLVVSIIGIVVVYKVIGREG